MVKEGDILWKPSQEWIADSSLTAFLNWLKKEHKLEFADRHALWRWSVDRLEDFWRLTWDYFQIESSAPYINVLGRREMPGAEWFPGAQLNYAQHVLRREQADTDVLYCANENTPLIGMPWPRFANDVRVLATQLRKMGVQRGDRVAGFLTNIPQAAVALLATSSIGAVWTGCSPDFGSRSILDRFSQVTPRVLIGVDGYYYRGKPFNRREEIRQIVSRLDSIEHVIFLPYLEPDNETLPVANAVLWKDLMNHPPVPAAGFRFEQVPFNHPLWVLYSSGTTGLPKAIVHGHGGILLEQMKLDTFHYNLKAGDRMFFYTTTGWMMWNFLISSILIGVKPVLYDGNPAYPEPDNLWRITDAGAVNLFGASPTFVQMQENAGVVPRNKYALSSLETIMLAGSPVSAECMHWFYKNVKQDLWVVPGSGGTDICSGFCGGMPGLPVYAGEIPMPHLGVDMQSLDDEGKPHINQVGEMVIAQPMPSMPIYFWNDKDNERYRESYFNVYPGLWRQGDYFKINERDGCFVLGRSDSTLNRYGIRIGTAEIYRSVETVDEVADSIIVNLDLPGGKFFMPLFVKLKDGYTLNEALEKKINARLRADYSPRHVPDQIYQVDDIPYTISGKKMEVPVRKILMGTPLEKAANVGVMSNPAALDYFVNFARERKDYSLN
jgi:acetoacetyl-CoA synthetase